MLNNIDVYIHTFSKNEKGTAELTTPKMMYVSRNSMNYGCKDHRRFMRA